MGPRTEEFERAFAEQLGVRHAIAVSSCTAALHLAYVSLGIAPGDEVIVPSFTFVATAHGILYCGGTPVFADIVGLGESGDRPGGRREEDHATDARGDRGTFWWLPGCGRRAQGALQGSRSGADRARRTPRAPSSWVKRLGPSAWPAPSRSSQTRCLRSGREDCSRQTTIRLPAEPVSCGHTA